jgi:hypothetical protein
MPSRPRRLRLPLIGAAVAIIALALLVLPPAPADTRPGRLTTAPAALLRGVVHVHTVRSDGSGTVDEVAAAAAAAGLHFIVLTDHGDGTRAPLPPAYRSGVLVIDGVEISTDAGHYVALGLGQAPYRLAGAAADVAADVRRLGGFGFAAHPDSPRAALAWRAWDAPIDGLEWFNLDSEWRDDGTARLLRALIGYPVRPVGAIALTIGDGGRLLKRWAGMAASRRVLGIAAVDAHARLGTEGSFDSATVSLRAPGYEALFATAQVGVELDARPSGDAARDAAALLRALRGGRFYSVIAARAPLGRLAFTIERGGTTARMGQFLGGSGTPVATIEADTPRRVATRIVCDGRLITQTLGDRYSRVLDEEADVRACQAVLGWPGDSIEAFTVWAVSNPIYFRSGDTEPAADPPVAARGEVLAAAASSWGVEHAPGSTARVEAAGPAPASPQAATPVRLDYALAPGARASQFAALVSSDIGTLSWARWLRVTLSADAPMRVSLQVREPSPGDPRRWQHSLVIGPEPSTHIVAIADLAPIPPATGPPPVTAVRSILVVVDTVNTPPGRQGRVVVHEIRAEAP